MRVSGFVLIVTISLQKIQIFAQCAKILKMEQKRQFALVGINLNINFFYSLLRPDTYRVFFCCVNIR